LIHAEFIVDSSPRVPILGVNSTHLETSFFQANHHKGQRLPIVLRLLAEGSVVVLVLALGWWGMATLGSSTLASQSETLTAKEPPIYVAGCPVVDALQQSAVKGEAGERRGCTEEGSSHPTTSRRPRGGLVEDAHAADR
jgi:hypothetical protein